MLLGFGTLSAEGREKSWYALVKELEAVCTDWFVTFAYTSEYISGRLSVKEGLCVFFPDVLRMLKMKGYEYVIVQPVFLSHRPEYREQLEKQIENCRMDFQKLQLGDFLLASKEDYVSSLHIIMQEASLSVGEYILLVLHGVHDCPSDVREKFQAYADELHFPVYVVELETKENGTLGNIVSCMEQKNIKKVCVIPFLFSMGTHIGRDIAGNGESSWKMVLKNAGFEVRVVMKGMGEIPAFRQFFCRKLQSLTMA